MTRRADPTKCRRNQWNFTRRSGQSRRDPDVAGRDAARRQRLNDSRSADGLEVFDRQPLFFELANGFGVDRDFGIEGYLTDYNFLGNLGDCRLQTERTCADHHRKSTASQAEPARHQVAAV